MHKIFVLGFILCTALQVSAVSIHEIDMCKDVIIVDDNGKVIKELIRTDERFEQCHRHLIQRKHQDHEHKGPLKRLFGGSSSCGR